MKIFYALISLLAISIYANAAPPEVAIVTGEKPEALEKHAAEELAGLLKTLFQAEAEISASVPEGAKNVILLGNAETNPAIPKPEWPAVISDQGHVLKSTKDGLIVGGGSPVATLWAVYEFGHSFGMRYMLHGDFPPIDAQEFSLEGFDAVLEPNVKTRAWRTLDSGIASQESWGLDDHRKLLKQLAKLKFNHVLLASESQPIELSVSVTGDTAGRSVFGGAKTFENPDFSGKTTETDKLDSWTKLLIGIRRSAAILGMTDSVDDKETGILNLSLGQPNGGLLPQFSTEKLAEELTEALKMKGFAAQCWIPGDHNSDVYFLSRASFDANITPEQSLESLVTPICGEGVAERLGMGFAALGEASVLIDENDAGFALPDPKMFMEHYESGKPVPEWWAKAKEHFGTATNEMYRGNTRARGGARPYILYHAKRFFFSLHYMTAIDHARLAGIARDEKDNEAWVENLELSIEAMHNALGIYAEVARDQSDRGVIAILNQYAYRPLLKALDETPLP
ncbi:MAG: hypothetical protein ACKVJU_18725 [Verrucomicrobiales bacterium]